MVRRPVIQPPFRISRQKRMVEVDANLSRNRVNDRIVQVIRKTLNQVRIMHHEPTSLVHVIEHERARYDVNTLRNVLRRPLARPPCLYALTSQDASSLSKICCFATSRSIP